MAGTFGKAVTAPMVTSWVRALSDLSCEEIIEGFRRMEKTFIPTAACPFPVPAHVRAEIDAARQNLEQVKAEQAWEETRAWMRKWYFSDCRDKKYPPLREILFRSLSAAGGLAHVADCSNEDLIWAKKRFIEAYLSLEQLQADAHFLPGAEAKQILKSLAPKETVKNLLKEKTI